MAGPADNRLCSVMVFGVGSIGERRVPSFLKTRQSAVSICEVNVRLREEVGQRYGVSSHIALQSALEA